MRHSFVRAFTHVSRRFQHGLYPLLVLPKSAHRLPVYQKPFPRGTCALTMTDDSGLKSMMYNAGSIDKNRRNQSSGRSSSHAVIQSVRRSRSFDTCIRKKNKSLGIVKAILRFSRWNHDHLCKKRRTAYSQQTSSFEVHSCAYLIDFRR
jgi:hypothetical protein